MYAVQLQNLTVFIYDIDELLESTTFMAFQVLKYSYGNLPVKLLSERSITRRVWNSELVVGLLITPWRRFDRSVSSLNFGRVPSHEGKTSRSWLLPRLRLSSTIQFANDRGSRPSNWLWLRSIILNMLPLFDAHSWGILPWKELFLMFNTETELLRSCIHCGSIPLKKLLDKSRSWRELRLQNKGEISCPLCLLSPSSYAQLWSTLVKKLSLMAMYTIVSLLVFHIHLGIGPCISFPPRFKYLSLSWCPKKSGNSPKFHEFNPNISNLPEVAFF